MRVDDGQHDDSRRLLIDHLYKHDERLTVCVDWWCILMKRQTIIMQTTTNGDNRQPTSFANLAGLIEDEQRRQARFGEFGLVHTYSHTVQY